MFARHHLSASIIVDEQLIGRLGAGQSVTTVSFKSTIPKLKVAAEGGNAMQKHAGGRQEN